MLHGRTVLEIITKPNIMAAAIITRQIPTRNNVFDFLMLDTVWLFCDKSADDIGRVIGLAISFDLLSLISSVFISIP